MLSTIGSVASQSGITYKKYNVVQTLNNNVFSISTTDSKGYNLSYGWWGIEGNSLVLRVSASYVNSWDITSVLRNYLNVSIYDSSSGTKNEEWYARCTLKGYAPSIGAFIGIIVVSTEIYPINGMHIDGYWYVKQ